MGLHRRHLVPALAVVAPLQHRPHEREEVGMAGMALALFAGPVYVAAAAARRCAASSASWSPPRRALRTVESARTFRLHLCWALAAAGLLAASFALDHDYPLLRSGRC
ncbi:hypothetical protein V2I01_34445 [Micromonospora sp. BRA006-A]|nr:hypothetical protein [Micromonospora sp. BRA006-A]